MKTRVPRRQFLQASGAALGAFGAVHSASLNAQSANSPSGSMSGERIRFGIIGVGMEGSGVLKTAIELPGVECVGAADLYDGRHLLAKQITGNPNLFVTRNYQDLLKRKDIDCILAAVPGLLAYARCRGCVQRGQGYLLREAYVSQGGRRVRNDRGSRTQ